MAQADRGVGCDHGIRPLEELRVERVGDVFAVAGSGVGRVGRVGWVEGYRADFEAADVVLIPKRQAVLAEVVLVIEHKLNERSPCDIGEVEFALLGSP